MHNAPLRTFTLFIRPDERSKQIAEKIRQLNSKSSQPLVESADGDFVIAIGGDGTFIDAVTKTTFSKKKLYTGVHTGTLGFLQDLDEKDIFSLFQYLNFSQILNTRKVYIPVAKVFLKNGVTKQFNALNEVLISGKDNSKIIRFSEYIHGRLLHNVAANGIIISSSTGDTAYSRSAGGAIDLSNNFQLVCTLLTPLMTAVNERFIPNSIICRDATIVLKPSDNISIIIDGILQDIDSSLIEKVEVSVAEDNYITKLDILSYDKVDVIRNKLLGYN